MSEAPKSSGMLKELVGSLPPLARTILMWMLLFPIAVAISGMLLQVNVGALIQDSLKQSRGQTVDIFSTLLKEQIDEVKRQLADVQRSQLEGKDIYANFDKRITLVERELEYLKQSQRARQ